MCGICGIGYGNRGAELDPARLMRMNDALAHRGPDDSGSWLGGHVGLAMRRLGVIDLFRGQQPMSNDDNTTVIVFNGEIYNFVALRGELERRGHAFNTLSDTEVIVRGYDEFGDGVLEHLNGMFAFAVYDVRRDRLLIARDRMGVKPLFYTWHDGVLAFSSELDSLLRSGLVPGGLNHDALSDYFTYLYIPGPDTAYRHVRKLMPGNKLVFENASLSEEPYWRLKWSIDPAWRTEDATDRFRELLTDAVKIRTISDVPLGAFLSGGIDSSAVVAVLNLVSDAPVKTFTIGFDDAHADELSHARLVAEALGTSHTEDILRPDMVSAAGAIARHFGEPFADSSAIPTWLVSQAARRSVTVALSGDGGDELFGGYTWLHMARRVQHYRQWTPAALRGLVQTALNLAPNSALTGRLRRFNRDTFLTPDEAFRRRLTCFDESLKHELFRPEFLEQMNRSRTDRFDTLIEEGSALEFAERMLHVDTHMYLPDDILAKVDRMTMAHGLEARSPFLDYRLAEFAATLPFQFKVRGRTSKWLVKHTLKELLPAAILNRPKHGFGVPLHAWFRGPLRAPFEELALADDARGAAFLHQARVRQLFAEHVSGQENRGHHMWVVYMFEQWLRYIEGIPGFSMQ